MDRLAALRHVAAVFAAAGSAPEEPLAGERPVHPPLGYTVSNEKPVPEYKQRQRELAHAAKRRRVLHSSSIRVYAEKNGVSAIPSKVIVDSFDQAQQIPESK